eukprot:scaffold111843_cov57-Phaeocystis_antarctica.AAC.1
MRPRGARRGRLRGRPAATVRAVAGAVRGGRRAGRSPRGHTPQAHIKITHCIHQLTGSWMTKLHPTTYGPSTSMRHACRGRATV